MRLILRLSSLRLIRQYLGGELAIDCERAVGRRTARRAIAVENASSDVPAIEHAVIADDWSWVTLVPSRNLTAARGIAIKEGGQAQQFRLLQMAAKQTHQRSVEKSARLGCQRNQKEESAPRSPPRRAITQSYSTTRPSRVRLTTNRFVNSKPNRS